MPLPLARHVAWVCSRDPLVIGAGREALAAADGHVEHFELLQSTNWNSVRLKPPLGKGPAHGPPPAPSTVAEPETGGGAGWRVELRTMEAGLTDFENAAFAILSALFAAATCALGARAHAPHVPRALRAARFARPARLSLIHI